MKGPKDLRQGVDGGMFRGIAEHLKLIWLLWNDPRISPFLKLLPLGSLVYLISPLDMAIPIVDDVGVMWFFTYLFIELSPQEIVEEHRRTIRNTVNAEWAKTPQPDFEEEDIQDAEFHETSQ